MSPLPPAVRAALGGQPGVGDWDPISFLVTVDTDGGPHVCLLSRAQLAASETRIAATVTSRTATANLTAGSSALLVLLGDDDAAYHLRLSLRTPIAERLGFTVGTFDVADVRRDAVGVELRPALFRSTDELVGTERWELSRRLLAEALTDDQAPEEPE